MDANDDKDATSDDGTGKGDRPLATSARMRKNCKDIKDNNADAKSGLYLVRIEGNNQYSWINYWNYKQKIVCKVSNTSS